MSSDESLSARACGCDPRENHVCEGHANARDKSETEPAIGGFMNLEDRVLDSFVAVTTGPDEDGQIGIMAPGLQWLWFDRFELEKLVTELQRRLALRV